MKNDKEKFKKEFKQRIYKSILDLIKFLDSLDRKDPVVRVTIDQLLRSATSIGANYIEAQAANSKKDFTRFFHYSLKSANESKFWLALLRDSSKANKQEVNQLLDELVEISNIFGTSLITLKHKD
jgi:four helix bundle protein